jgi:hypothetical protein
MLGSVAGTKPLSLCCNSCCQAEMPPTEARSIGKRKAWTAADWLPHHGRFWDHRIFNHRLDRLFRSSFDVMRPPTGRRAGSTRPGGGWSVALLAKAIAAGHRIEPSATGKKINICRHGLHSKARPCSFISSLQTGHRGVMAGTRGRST